MASLFALSGHNRSSISRALALFTVSVLLSATAASRDLPGDSPGNWTAAHTAHRRLLQSNDWSQPGTGPVDVNRVNNVLAKYVKTDVAGILLRMLFHDAGTYDKGSNTGGANGSLRFELDRALNNPMSAQWHVIESIKSELSDVSYADIIFLAGVYAVHVTGGPLVTSVQTGRVDATGPDPDDRLPISTWGIDQLTSHFSDAYGFGCEELVALSGAHSIGTSKVTQKLGPMDDTWTKFDNDYYQKVRNGGGSFNTDNALTQSTDTSPFVYSYAGDQFAWWLAFVDALKKLGDLGATYQ